MVVPVGSTLHATSVTTIARADVAVTAVALTVTTTDVADPSKSEIVAQPH